MTQYAERTRVPVSQSRVEIERVLVRYGADAFAFGTQDGRSVVQFRANGRFVRFTVQHPDARELSRAQFEQRERQQWRALLLVVKSKLEAVESGVESFEEAFMAHIVLPDGGVVKDWLTPQIEQAYDGGKMPALLPAGA